MEWNARTPSLWDWDNIALPYDAGDYKTPGAGSWAGGGASTSSSEMDNFSSTGSSPRGAADVVPSPVLEFEDYHNGITFFLDADSSPAADRTEESSPTPISLKLGKRTYFEDTSMADGQSAAPSKKPRESDQSLQQQAVYCQVEGCDVELGAAKEYYRKHRVCEDHTKCPRVIVAGQERRFCQQCSRFHELLEFDQKKRSCRKRLSDHNARRRKPQPDIISFCSSIFTLSTYDDEDEAHQISFLWDKTPNGNMRPGASSAWGCLHNSKLPRAGSWPLMKNAEAEVGQLCLPNAQISSGWTSLCNEAEKTLPLKGSGTAGVLNQISSAVSSASNLGGGLDLPGVLSLMSANSWPSSDPGEITSPFQLSDPTSTLAQPFMHAKSSISAGQYWQHHGSSHQSLSQQTTMLSFQLQEINGNQTARGSINCIKHCKGQKINSI